MGDGWSFAVTGAHDLLAITILFWLVVLLCAWLSDEGDDALPALRDEAQPRALSARTPERSITSADEPRLAA